MTTTLQDVYSVQDVMDNHIVPFMTFRDLARLELTNPSFGSESGSRWRALCRRDFTDDPTRVPKYEPTTGTYTCVAQDAACPWKDVYRRWQELMDRVDGGMKAAHFLQATSMMQRLRTVLNTSLYPTSSTGSSRVVFAPTPSKRIFQKLSARHTPSSVKAFFAVQGGQNPSPSLGLVRDRRECLPVLGAFRVYDVAYSMALIGPELFVGAANDDGSEADEDSEQNPSVPSLHLPYGSSGNGRHFTPVAMSLVSSIPMALIVDYPETPYESEGRVVCTVLGHTSIKMTFGELTILDYMDEYIRRLETGVYKVRPMWNHRQRRIEQHISLFRESGSSVSEATTRGVRIRASSLLLPFNGPDTLQFAYSVRIMFVDEQEDEGADGESAVPTTTTTAQMQQCQLISRHWKFRDGDGSIRAVDGEGVIGKQPALRRGGGYYDLGFSTDCTGRFEEGEFVYQSMSGPVAGTSLSGGGRQAAVWGTFQFVPGTIQEPEGEPFHAEVALFPLDVSMPRY